MTYAPCANWLTSQDDLCSDCMPVELDDPIAQAVIDTWGPVASLVLWSLTGRIYPGTCTDQVWPRLTGRCGQWLSYGDGLGSRPLPVDGWEGFGQSWPIDRCDADHAAILLPHTPVRRVVEVTIGGEVVDPGLYRLKDRRWLIRCDGDWPCSQRPCDDPMSVTYEWGIRPPVGGAQMAGRLACEYQRACTPGCECRLPAHVQSVVQEGFTQNLLITDPMTLLDKGRTGLDVVDHWITALNPHGLDRDAKVLTPFGPHFGTHHLR